MFTIRKLQTLRCPGGFRPEAVAKRTHRVLESLPCGSQSARREATAFGSVVQSLAEFWMSTSNRRAYEWD